MRKLLTTGGAARVLGISRERVRDLLREGQLTAVSIDGWGRRLLDADDVERLARLREERRRKRL